MDQDDKEVGLGPDDIVLDGAQLPPKKGVYGRKLGAVYGP